jgi:hypothetical protein
MALVTRVHTNGPQNRGFMPKMNFPKFSGKNPRIWKDKCEYYFTLLEALHMQDNAET